MAEGGGSSSKSVRVLGVEAQWTDTPYHRAETEGKKERRAAIASGPSSLSSSYSRSLALPSRLSQSQGSPPLFFFFFTFDSSSYFDWLSSCDLSPPTRTPAGCYEYRDLFLHPRLLAPYRHNQYITSTIPPCRFGTSTLFKIGFPLSSVDSFQFKRLFLSSFLFLSRRAFLSSPFFAR